jgi:RecB family exonuclease
MSDLSMPAPTGNTTPSRRLIAAGLIRRLPGRTITVRATQAGVTGSISKAVVAELHRLCDEDYASSAARRAQTHRDDAHLIASASEAVAAQ